MINMFTKQALLDTLTGKKAGDEALVDAVIELFLTKGTITKSGEDGVYLYKNTTSEDL